MKTFNDCIRKKKIVSFKATKEMIEKEFTASEADLASAERSLTNSDLKWSSIQSYYSMFHAAKALIYLKGYREKSHFCLIIAMRHLYGDPGDIKQDVIDDLELALSVRHEADYGLTYTEQSAKNMLKNAANFLKISKRFK